MIGELVSGSTSEAEKTKQKHFLTMQYLRVNCTRTPFLRETRRETLRQSDLFGLAFFLLSKKTLAEDTPCPYTHPLFIYET